MDVRFCYENGVTLGKEADNVFIQRANEISKKNYAIVKEIDDSTPNDL
ncbi:hypothetical protein [Leptospira borgpetersenii]|uniref:Uncharacterized protein n=4 Tax=Leptospira borgpetersenii TaxID=174 RepID=M3HM08_LEPBO|nr:hypothetical protein [Leptospira borgpetersenii]EKP14954.1 hypothetical protein LEP1GSC128_2393 [Leptospira borgpetersenii str. 200801926]EKQ90027.1 hypothetical protein LEP1GSC101_2188 [Leptospira borgpetersenii str. UI 09149]EKQ99317.1 hypothetical protein LEP1GSC121_2564 [Leptospira borgpetersenii serovar Castellonis str. 200801910]EMF99095.1 hypothetical protein LEP1GSC123_0164 [Leptospira borgpetersenii str. 200701203]EMK12090.1 hypothetical protein LEP1GSC066_2950 [Leptospira sp. sero